MLLSAMRPTEGGITSPDVPPGITSSRQRASLPGEASLASCRRQACVHHVLWRLASTDAPQCNASRQRRRLDLFQWELAARSATCQAKPDLPAAVESFNMDSCRRHSDSEDGRPLTYNFYQISYIEATLSIMSFIYLSLLPINPDQTLTWFFPKLFSL